MVGRLGDQVELMYWFCFIVLMVWWMLVCLTTWVIWEQVRWAKAVFPMYSIVYRISDSPITQNSS